MGDSARWTQNRSYFLRLNKNRENNNNNRDWARLNNNKPGSNHRTPDRNATVRALADELDENKLLVRRQAQEIEDLQEHVNELQALQMQEESERVEAEIGR